ncbi:MAG: helix-turn-helix transcriptional regulator [Parcubacteria group bacterium]|nr:helix-turn-helix transcriptional regulator [Parcubacteria group bacterium]
MNDQTKKRIGENIKKLREKLKLSQGELAKNVGKQTATYIAFIEKGERNITTVDLMAIAKQLGATVASLIGEEKIKSTTFKEALRASKDLTPSDRNKMEHYFDYIKSGKDDK